MRTWKIGTRLLWGIALLPLSLNLFFAVTLTRALIWVMVLIGSLCGWAILCDHVPHGIPGELETLKREGKTLYPLLAFLMLTFFSVIFRWMAFPILGCLTLWVSGPNIKKQLKRRTRMSTRNANTENERKLDGKSDLVCNITVSRKMQHTRLTPKQVKIAREQIAGDHLLFHGATFKIEILEGDELLLQAGWELFDAWWSSSLIKAEAKKIDHRQEQLLRFVEDAEAQIRYLLTVQDFLAAGRGK